MHSNRDQAFTTKRAGYQDVLDAPPHMVAQVLDGVLYTFPRPALRHARASSCLGGVIGGPFDYDRGWPGGWWILNEPELHLGEDIVVPDIAGWRRAFIPKIPEAAYWTVRPDWVCEVLSPSTRALDMGAKRDFYMREGVPYLWLVDPLARSLEGYALRRGVWAILSRFEGDALVSLPPFEAVSFDLGNLWLDAATPPRPPRGHQELHDRDSA